MSFGGSKHVDPDKTMLKQAELNPPCLTSYSLFLLLGINLAILENTFLIHLHVTNYTVLENQMAL